jgi:hypothetical protein
MLQLRRQAEIGHLDSHVTVQKEVAELEIPVNHTTPVKILEANDEVVYVEHGFSLRQTLIGPALNEFVECLIWAKFENNVDIFAIFEIIDELDHLFVVERLMNCNLGPEFRMCTGLRNRGLHDNLRCKNLIGLHVAHLVAFCEASLA